MPDARSVRLPLWLVLTNEFNSFGSLGKFHLRNAALAEKRRVPPSFATTTLRYEAVCRLKMPNIVIVNTLLYPKITLNTNFKQQ